MKQIVNNVIIILGSLFVLLLVFMMFRGLFDEISNTKALTQAQNTVPAHIKARGSLIGMTYLDYKSFRRELNEQGRDKAQPVFMTSYVAPDDVFIREYNDGLAIRLKNEKDSYIFLPGVTIDQWLETVKACKTNK